MLNRLLFSLISIFHLVALMFVVAIHPADGFAQTRLKAGTLAPEGSPWLNKWNDFVKDFETTSPAPVKIITYPGGVMGDEADMVRKLKFGQLQMLGVTVAGIAGIMPEILVLNLPFLFNNYQEVDYVVDKLMPEFQKYAAKRGVHLVGMLDQGMIEAYSKVKINSPEEFIQQKVWIWNADQVAVKLAEALDINGVPLPVPEVLTSLQTGLINSMFSSSTALVSLQWHTQMSYYYPFKLRYDPAVFFITDKAIKSIPADKQAAFKADVSKSFAKHFGPFAAELRQTEADLVEQIIDQGVQKVEWDAAKAQPLIEKARATWNQLAGDLYPPELLDKVKSALAEFRSGK